MQVHSLIAKRYKFDDCDNFYRSPLVAFLEER